MTRAEWRAGVSLSVLFALRMAGLFLILPVFAVHAAQLAGGDNKTLVGIALGIYGFSQAVLLVPFGMASDRLGRKRVIMFGLILFAAGSFIASAASGIWGTIAGRFIQGAGAISAAVVAMAADLTRDQHRTKVMAMIGASIGLTFALSLVAAPPLYRSLGLSGMFDLVGALAIAAIAVVVYLVPEEPARGRQGRPGTAADGPQPPQAKPSPSLRHVLANVELMRLNAGIFVLHMVQVAMFVVVPVALVSRAGLDLQSHWKVYLPALLASFALMMPPILVAEKRGRIRELFLGSILALLAAQIGFALWMKTLVGIGLLLTLFFVAFNILEASLPSLVSRIAPAAARGTAIGVYNTTQSLGLAAGGLAGGWFAQNVGADAVFAFGAGAVMLWLVVAAGMRAPGQVARRTLKLGSAQNHQELREKLGRLRGVRDVRLDPALGVAVLSVYAGNWDEQAAMDIIGGST